MVFVLYINKYKQEMARQCYKDKLKMKWKLCDLDFPIVINKSFKIVKLVKIQIFTVQNRTIN